MNRETRTIGFNFVLKGGRNIAAKQTAEFMTTTGAIGVLPRDEPASSALRVKCVPTKAL